MKISNKNDWKECVIDALIVCFIYQKEHEENPRKALYDLIEYETKLALDPQVSGSAQALIDKGRDQAMGE